MKKILTTFTLLTFISFGIKAQTNVSGGIFANTTWTMANSPYIVTSNVVVFPGFTLTIQPGVTVKFKNNQQLEIRQAKLLAIGTAIDSITFTSDSVAPAPGVYSGIYLNAGSLTSKFNYCKFNYANIGINATSADSLIVSNSNFSNDSIGLQFIGNTVAQVAMINNTVFTHNPKQGLIIRGLHYSGISNCNFLFNGIDGLIMDDMSGAMAVGINNCNFTNNDVGASSSMHHLNMNHCNFLNNTSHGLEGFGYMSPFDSYANSIKNSVFSFNQTGIAMVARMKYDSCTIKHNQTGSTSGGVCRIKNSTIDSNAVLGWSAYNDSIIYCNVKYNGTGIVAASLTIISGSTIEYSTGANISAGAGTTKITGNTISFGAVGIDNNAAGTFTITQNTIDNNGIGINSVSSISSISCNRICNNTTYDFKYGGSAALNADHNYWCTPDSAITQTLIYDGHNNLSYGLVNFMPVDSVCVPGGITTGISNNTSQTFSFSVFPNPASDNLTIELPKNILRSEIKILNLLGELEYSSKALTQKTNVDISTLGNGLHVVQITSGNNVSRQRFVKQ